MCRAFERLILCKKLSQISKMIELSFASIITGHYKRDSRDNLLPQLMRNCRIVQKSERALMFSPLEKIVFN